jgi:hypothetical protein
VFAFTYPDVDVNASVVPVRRYVSHVIGSVNSLSQEVIGRTEGSSSLLLHLVKLSSSYLKSLIVRSDIVVKSLCQCLIHYDALVETRIALV